LSVLPHYARHEILPVDVIYLGEVQVASDLQPPEFRKVHAAVIPRESVERDILQWDAVQRGDRESGDVDGRKGLPAVNDEIAVRDIVRDRDRSCRVVYRGGGDLLGMKSTVHEEVTVQLDVQR